MRSSTFLLTHSLATIMLCAVASNPAPCQTEAGAAPSSRAGEFWVGLSLGPGVGNTVCPPCGEGGARTGFGFEVTIGATPADNLRLGFGPMLFIEGTGMFNALDPFEGRKAYRLLLQFSAAYYPSPDGRFFTRAGIGIASYASYNRYSPPLRDVNGAPMQSQVYGSGVGFSLGAGYEISVSESVILIPMLGLAAGHLPEVTLNDRTVVRTNATTLIALLNVGLRIHRGP